MKLIPPAGSSDLDEARAIARRLSGTLRGAASETASAAHGYASFVAPARERPAASAPGEVEAPMTWAADASAPHAFAPPLAPVFERPPEPAFEPPLAPAFDPEPPPFQPEPAASRSRPPAYEPSVLEAEPPLFRSPALEPPPFETPGLGAPAFEAPAFEPPAFEAPVFEPPAPAPFDSGAGSDAVDALVQGLVPEPAVEEAAADPLADLAQPEALAEPGEPSWDDILERCQNFAQAHAALLIGADGRPVAAYGAWPAAGVDAVAAKLLPLLEKKEQKAPGSGLSVRLAERILTAWRLTLEDQPATVAFLADVPIGTELRPDIEDELHRGRL